MTHFSSTGDLSFPPDFLRNSSCPPLQWVGVAYHSYFIVIIPSHLHNQSVEIRNVPKEDCFSCKIYVTGQVYSKSVVSQQERGLDFHGRRRRHPHSVSDHKPLKTAQELEKAEERKKLHITAGTAKATHRLEAATARTNGESFTTILQPPTGLMTDGGKYNYKCCWIALHCNCIWVERASGIFGKPCTSQTTELKDINEITELLSWE